MLIASFLRIFSPGFLLLTTTAFAGEPTPPRAALVVETINGVEWRDPYRWMEKGGAEFDAWAKAESAHARESLNAIPGRNALYQRIAALDQPSAGVRSLQMNADRWLYKRVPQGGKTEVLFSRQGRDGAERKVDLLGGFPAAEGPWSEVGVALVLSPDGRYLTFGTTQKGEANPTLRVYDLKNDRMLQDTVVWPLWADSRGFRPRWLADSSGFFYVRRADSNAAMDNAERARRGRVFLHRLGDASEKDRAIFGYRINSEITDTDTLYVQGEPHSRWLTIWRRMPEARELWVLDLASLPGSKIPQARRIWSSDVSVPGYGVKGNWLYTTDTNECPRFCVVRYDLTQSVPKAEVVMAQQQGVLSHLVVARDAVYVVESVLNHSRLHVIENTGTRQIKLPEGAVAAMDVGPDGKGTWLTQVDWLKPEQGLLLLAGELQLRDVGFAAPTTKTKSDYVSRVEWAIARDGERIPYTIVQRADAKADGTAYVMMEGYGCFGSASPPFYWPSLTAWLERGGAFVRVALRGGGELGADWHRAGRDRNKPTSFEDAIDVAKHLIRVGITRPGRIGVTGGSCGGITMGMAALEAPHLIAAAALSVGAFDPWRMVNSTSAGARSIRDIGDPATDEGTRRIWALSPYMQALDGAQRPAFLIMNGATDYAIPLWVGGKMVARTRAAAPKAKPVLWNIEWEAGHNIGVDYTAVDTDQMAFLFWQLGHPEFQHNL